MVRILRLSMYKRRPVRQPKLSDENVELPPRPLPLAILHAEEVDDVQAAVHGVEIPLDSVPVPIDEVDQVREGASPIGRYPWLIRA